MSQRQAPAILAHGLQAGALNTVIALGIAVFGEHDFGRALVYSQSIGLSIWGLIDIGRLGLIPNPQQQWRRLFWIVPLGVALGYVLGTLVAAGLLNDPSVGFWSDQPRKAVGFLVLSLVAGGASSYYFMSRAQLATVREEAARASAQAEAARRHAAESQLKLLQTQLEPHMLFNTLANLRVLIGLDAPRAQDMLDRLVAYLRATLDASRATRHSLQAEFDRLRDYLELMAVRMGPRLSFALELPPALASVPVPPLLLQALVENSIKHGLEPQVSGGRIVITAQQDGAHLLLRVQDDGVGLAQSEPPALPEGFGLAQVRERLQASYGALAGLELEAVATGGTRVVIRLPLSP